MLHEALLPALHPAAELQDKLMALPAELIAKAERLEARVATRPRTTGQKQ